VSGGEEAGRAGGGGRRGSRDRRGAWGARERDLAAAARRDERERQKAEEDARRAGQAEERAAKQKEEAERGAAIAVSLDAMCVEMEQLAASDVKDGRPIDRLLQQAAKSFEDIGKVPGEAATSSPIATATRAASS